MFGKKLSQTSFDRHLFHSSYANHFYYNDDMAIGKIADDSGSGRTLKMMRIACCI